ncbi:hypothetical protein H257_09413 [Aphanomyces astaci]|uniref:Uncharacterized protein n=1 Tax=Aphanomyces astaci TaxID=112090 RepID=W4GBC6_APHAT|nr:hypothetical protein H257_09413 [Aphanomyces astaci]ETV76379.1 hypothetical protein H257_09413 [Aphanomyces astaci]|eukprot:XP_009833924.1 hypothetical protein H257_09413 [Aphanomyces astaci]
MHLCPTRSRPGKLPRYPLRVCHHHDGSDSLDTTWFFNGRMRVTTWMLAALVGSILGLCTPFASDDLMAPRKRDDGLSSIAITGMRMPICCCDWQWTKLRLDELPRFARFGLVCLYCNLATS